MSRRPPRPWSEDEAPTDVLDASQLRAPASSRGRTHDRAWRAAVSGAVVLVLLAVAAVGLLWVARHAGAGAGTTSQVALPTVSTPATAPIPSSPGALLPGATTHGSGGRGRTSVPPTATMAPSAGTEPTLGIATWRPYSKGYGQVRPRTADAGGDGTSVVENLRWTTWGGPTARATGIASWVPPDAANAEGVQSPAIVIASGLGDCHGHPGYHRITWYFPGHGGTASDPFNGYDDLCTPE